MKTETKNRMLCLMALLFVAQCLAVINIYADDINISQKIFKSKYGTITIPAQTLQKYDSPIRYYITDVPNGFKPTRVFINDTDPDWPYLNDGYGGTITYEEYLQLKTMSVYVESLPITKPSGLVDVINGFVEDGARLSNSGEVIILKDVYSSEIGFAKPALPIQTDVTIIGAEKPDGLNAYHIGAYMELEIKNSNVLINNALGNCRMNTENSTIRCKGNNYIFGLTTKGNVQFEGVYDDTGNIDITSPCNPYRLNRLEVDFSDITNSTITFDNLSIFAKIVVPESSSINITNCDVFGQPGILDNEYISGEVSVQGGKIYFDNCYLEHNDIYEDEDVIANIESGVFKLNRSNVNDKIIVSGNDVELKIDSSQVRDNIIVNGKKADVKIGSGLFQGLTVQDGKVTVNNGYFPAGIEMDGGELEVNGGKVALITVKDEDSKIELNNGLFKGIKIPSGVNKSIYSMLGNNAGYYDRDGTFMPFKMLSIEGNDETEGSIIKSTTYPVSFVLSNYSAAPTPAFTAAQEASVGPDGTDVKVRNNGDLEIWTPKGLAWLAFTCSDTHDRVLTGREYFDNGKDWYLMSDLDMDGYGELWPELNINNRTFYGQCHRIYNMDVVRPEACFIKTVSAGAVVRDLIVEGSASNMDDEGGRMPDTYENIRYSVSGFAEKNKGLIVNCAYKGGVWNSEIGVLNIGGFVGTNHGRIENCYVAPCGQTIGGARYAGSHFENEYACSQTSEWYYVGGFAISNGFLATAPEDGFIENCYMGGNVSYGTTLTERDDISIKFVAGVMNMKGDPCERLYVTDADISAETLNKNALDHTPEMYKGTKYPYVEWAQWKESDDKQCGKPYFVWEKNIDGTPSAIGEVDAENGFKVWSEGGVLCFGNAHDADVSVYSVSGELIRQERSNVGSGRITLPKGIYVVKCGGVTKKVML